MLLTPKNCPNLQDFSVKVGSNPISPSESVKNIGVYFDQHCLMTDQVTNICKTAWWQLRKIGQIRHYLDQQSAERVIHAFVSSRLDQNNALLIGLPEYQFRKLRRIQYAAARILLRTNFQGHMTPVLKRLHWLPVELRVHYKILLTIYKCLNNQAPSYLSELLSIKHSGREM